MTVLVLGGTGEARALAGALHDRGVDLVSSLAGRVRNPRLPVGPVRIGGFGGVDGLANHLRDSGIDAVVDATHPFAARISANAAAACARANVPLLRLQRPGWADDGSWVWVDGHDAAATAAATGEGIFLSTGRQTLDRFVGPLAGHRVTVRVVEPLDYEVPASWTVVQARGPYTVEGERKLMRDNGIDTLVTKDSGGELTRAKLAAAGELGVRVIVVRRPEAPAGVAAVASVDDAVDWVLRSVAPPI
ncbi:cobalt-precorrin-6A reductase [Rhodococcus artemisiae]|uniref:Cobalt-precorrin-6A reductase n=1 Tax=Rhodococcus artemisiae TaxID=714159 RepID=A0ABU7LIE8_9NOCA|nr:cobalt-precorrin-6A reductase [Rhodococcus artemisiae]MEE2061019.1 cobalt-precorrin-6A reductase [Rhodococcus artemisiae]